MTKRRHTPLLPQAYIQAPPPVAYAPPSYEPKPVVNIDVLGSKNATVAKVKLAKHKDWTAAGTVYEYEAAESAKREQGDVADPVTGELLALARAFQRLSRDLFSEGNRRVRESVAAQEKAAEEAERRRQAARKPVRHRPLEEWQRIQRRAELFNVKPEETINYNVNEAALFSSLLPARTAAEEKRIAELKARRDELNITLRLLGEAE